MRAPADGVEERLGRSEEGLTVVEVIVAGVILVIGGLGVLGMVDAATHNTFRVEQSQVVNNVLQREMEAIKALPYEEIALSELPGGEAGENNPNSRVSEASFDLDRSEAASDLKEMVSGGSVAPGPEGFEVGDVNVEVSVYRYVVWDECPEEWLCAEGEGEQIKRIVVVAKLDSTAPGGSNRRYQELQGQVADPDAEPIENPGPDPGGDESTWWKLWLTDTTCDELERKEHPESDGNHPTHNTRGDCADGLVEGENVPGSPDLLWPTDLEAEEDRKYDYALDVEPQPEADEGLQLMPSGTCDSLDMLELARGVATAQDPDQHAFRKVHRWLTPQIVGEEVTLTGSGVFSLWTRTVSDFPYPGRICAWLFVRTYGEGPPTDTILINSGPPLSLHFEHFEQSWPHILWNEVTLNFDFEDEDGFQVTLPPGSRVGLALSVAEDTDTGLQFMYDQPSFDSQLQLETTGALPSF